MNAIFSLPRPFTKLDEQGYRRTERVGEVREKVNEKLLYKTLMVKKKTERMS